MQGTDMAQETLLLPGVWAAIAGKGLRAGPGEAALSTLQQQDQENVKTFHCNQDHATYKN